VDAGDHAVLIGEVLQAEHHNGRPLVYFGSGYHKLDGASGE
jgi:flavin reductase (DIM6/NTAB) family NADH-FMN oxidoreductase RutF